MNAPAFRVRAPRSPDELEACLALRWRLLRAPWQQPRGSERDVFDDTAVHRLAEAADGRLIGTGRLHAVDEACGQIRYMAVLPEWQGRGVGSALLASLEAAARDIGCIRIRLNAREGAVGFYARRGYVDAGPGPLLFDSIRHRVMEKVVRREPCGA
ncbi:GNAT family N-acetyltransferase [Thiohalobacter sp.]|uniref:GNAT family N-acetyltransferase n=1 Tax=Thiohalobacter sp. TaxID=2025948 RepID=UPI002612550A|nr:GNAT family N-acetyltransferase [Thiohalobacter sp.]